MGRSPLFLWITQRAMSLEQDIRDLITPTLLSHGFGVVRIQIQGSQRKTLQIMVERMDGINITVDDCAHVSRMASVLLDVADPIHDSYVLEVTSPGLDRPLVSQADFQRFAGAMIKIELSTPYEGSRRFQGLLLGMEGELIKIQLDLQKEVAEFAFSDIQKAKLIPDYKVSTSH